MAAGAIQKVKRSSEPKAHKSYIKIDLFKSLYPKSPRHLRQTDFYRGAK